MTDGNTYAINKRLNDQEDFDALQEIYTELEQAEAETAMLIDRIEELEAKLKTAEEIGRAFEEDAGQLREKLEKTLKALYRLGKLTAANAVIVVATLAELKGQDDE